MPEQLELFPDFSPIKPRIVPRSEHPISRKMIPREALKVLYRLHDAGYLAYLVGGSVRDLLLGLPPKDFDVGTDARPEEIRRLFRASRIIGRRFRLVHVYFRGGKFVEVVTFRGPESAEENGEEIYGTPEEDAFRRDLTINALFYNIADFTIIDYVGGLEDLKNGTIRVIGNPDLRFIRDPVRMLRAIRHAARAGFTIEPATWEGILRHREKIRLCSPIRLRDEWLKDVSGGWAAPWLDLMLKSGLFREIFPLYHRAFLDRPDLQNFLKTLLARADTLVKQNRLSQAGALAFFLYPYLLSRNFLRPLEKPERPTQEVERYLLEILGSYRFCKELFEETVVLLSALLYLRFFALKGKSPPKKLVRKSYFPELRLLSENIFPEEKKRLKIEVKARKKKRRRK
ncbi:polynucleotide adenylyltransferase PcnB [Thermosulfurimonas dismutans]|uniref:Poly(A) polymerase n=1 Tax=Thermosulfurimonas dismutans TaxID=999894 RepID=A0A179D4R2_9BACT|nr:polynucleotide adenylyltransferase PcnB [Thermosulfurimonas dismutans]OAQ20598.1 Poly(A) polymerase [Thermosulfurimonas dismutans]